MQKSVGGALGAICLAALFSTLPAISGGNPSNRQADVIQTSRGELRITPVYHGSVMLEFGGKVIHVDPWSQGDFTGLPPADLIVITHTHQDHLDRTMVDKLKKPETIIVGPPAVIDTLNCAPACGIVEAISDSEQRTVMGIGFEGVPMYNLVFGSGPGKPYHHKGIGSGYVLNFGDTRVYFSGDTECTPEMKALKNINVAFLAMNPPRTETTARSRGVRESVQAENCVPLSLSRLKAGRVLRRSEEYARSGSADSEVGRRAVKKFAPIFSEVTA